MVAVAILWARLVGRATSDERGASVVEYALLVSLIAVVCLAAVAVLGGSVFNLFDSSGSSIVQAG
jgi:pilus assembly protein Flp/PilA